MFNRKYNELYDKYNVLQDKYYKVDLEVAEYRLLLIELRNVFENKKLDTPEKRINRIKKIIKGFDKK